MPMDTFAAAAVSVRPFPVSLDFGSADGIRRKAAAMANKKQPLTRASRRRPAAAQGSQRQRPQVHGDHQPSPPLSVAHHGTLPLSPLVFATGGVQQQQINLAADPDPMLSSTRLHSPPAPPMPGTEADYHPKLLRHPHLARSVSSLPLSEEDHLLLELDENKEEEEEDPFLLLDNTRHRLSPSFSPPSSSNANSSPLDEMFQPNPAAGNNSNYFSSAQRRPHSGATAVECSLLLAADKMNSPISSTLAPLQSLVAQQRQQHSHFGGGNWPMIGATGSPTTSPCSLPSPNEFLHQSANTANFPLMASGCHDGFFPVGCGCGGLSSSSQNSSSTSSLHLLSYQQQQQQQQHQPHSHLNSDAEPKFTVSAAPPLAFLASSNGNDPVGSFAEIPQRRVIVLDTSSANLYASGHHQSLGSPTASFLSQNVNGNFHHPSYSNNHEHQSNCHNNNGNLFATEDGHGNSTSFSSAAGGGLVSIKYEYDSGAVPPPTNNSNGSNHFSSHQGHHNFVYQHQSQQQNLAQHLSMQSAPFPNPICGSRSGPAFLIGTDQQQQLKAEVGEVKYSTQLQAAEARKAGAEFDLHIGANGQQLIINNGKSSDGEKTAAEELTQQQYNIYIDYGNHNSTLMPTAANFLDATEEATGARCQQKSPAAYGKHSNGQSKANSRKLNKSRQTPMAQQQQQPTIAVTSQLLDGAGIEPMFGDDQLIFPGSPCSFGEVGGFLDCDGNSRGEADEIDTLRLAQHISQELKRYSIPQAIFAQRVLCRSQGTLSDLLRNPKPWAKLKSGRETFRRMAKWLQEPELHRMSALRLAACKRKEELVIRESAAAVVAASAAAEANNQQQLQQQKSSPQSPPPSQLSANGDANGESSRGRSPAAADDTKSPNNNGGGGNGNNRNASGGAAAQQKKPRLVFTDIQRRTLQAIFNETKRPSRELQVQIAQQLQLDPTTVANFFMNARRRGHGLQLINGSNGTSEMAAAVLPVDGTGSCCTPRQLIGSSSSCNSNSLCSSSVSAQCSAPSTPNGHEAIGSCGNRNMLKPLDASNSPPVASAMQPNWGMVEAANEEMAEERSQFGKADVKEEEQEVEHQAGENCADVAEMNSMGMDHDG